MCRDSCLHVLTHLIELLGHWFLYICSVKWLRVHNRRSRSNLVRHFALVHNNCKAKTLFDTYSSICLRIISNYRSQCFSLRSPDCSYYDFLDSGEYQRESVLQGPDAWDGMKRLSNIDFRYVMENCEGKLERPSLWQSWSLENLTVWQFLSSLEIRGCGVCWSNNNINTVVFRP